MTVCTIQDVIRETNRMIGTGYITNGRCDQGVDCSGMLVVVCKRLGIPHEDAPEPYRQQVGINALKEYFDRQMVRIPKAAVEPGDWFLAWFDRHTRDPQHCGMFDMMGTGMMGIIHAWQFGKDPRVVKHHLDKKWNRRIVECYRMPEHLVSR